MSYVILIKVFLKGSVMKIKKDILVLPNWLIIRA